MAITIDWDKIGRGILTPEDFLAKVEREKIKYLDDFLVLENIICVDADGNEFEKYDKIFVKKKVEKDPHGVILKLTPYAGISHCEENGVFLPSSALLANIYVALHKTAVGELSENIHGIRKEEAEQMLQEFKNRGDGLGGQWTNTLLNWGSQEIIHYPHQSDFLTSGGGSNINLSLPRKVYPFDRANFKTTDLAAALSIPNFRCYVQNYTGLSRPEDLLGVAQYFGKTAQVWISTSTVFRAAWFGCDSNDLFLYSSDDLNYYSAVRGVRGI